jgi:uncharacterized protein (DUF488 family)
MEVLKGLKPPIQMLTKRFKELMMVEDERFDKVVRKILRSLLKTFRSKVTAIQEGKDIGTMRI